MNKVIIFPTDTVYGIGASVKDIEGMEKIYAIKKRSKDKPLAVLCADLAQIEEIAVLNDIARKLIKRFLPGAVTFILPAKDIIIKNMGIKTVGVRIPKSEIALEILKKNGAMATTSVNESGEKPLNNYQEIKEKYSSLVDEIYDSNLVSSNVSSTVIDITSTDFKVLREGDITLKMIEDYLNVQR